MPNRYRKKAIEVEAVQWTGENLAEIGELTEPDVPHLRARVLYFSGNIYAVPSQWVVRHPDGAIHSYSTDFFETTYEERGEVEGQLTESLWWAMTWIVGEARMPADVGGLPSDQEAFEKADTLLTRLKENPPSASSQPVLDVEGLRQNFLANLADPELGITPERLAAIDHAFIAALSDLEGRNG